MRASGPAFYDAFSYHDYGGALKVGPDASVVDGLEPPTCSEPAPDVDAYEFRDGGRSVTVLWSYDGKAHTVRPPGGTTALDALGNPMSATNAASISDVPVYWLR